MSFDDYFDMHDGLSMDEMLLRFAVGVAPGGTHLKYMDTSSVDFSAKAGPSLALACQIASALVATEVVNLVTGKRPVKAAPHFSQFDPQTRRYVSGRLRWGNRGPVQRAKMWYVRRFLLAKGEAQRAASA